MDGSLRSSCSCGCGCGMLVCTDLCHLVHGKLHAYDRVRDPIRTGAYRLLYVAVASKIRRNGRRREVRRYHNDERHLRTRPCRHFLVTWGVGAKHST